MVGASKSAFAVSPSCRQLLKLEPEVREQTQPAEAAGLGCAPGNAARKVHAEGAAESRNPCEPVVTPL